MKYRVFVRKLIRLVEKRFCPAIIKRGMHDHIIIDNGAMSLDVNLKSVYDLFKENDFDSSFLTFFIDSLKASLYRLNECNDHVFPILVNYKNNRQFLQNKPCLRFHDLAVYFSFFQLSENLTSSACVTDKLIERWGISVDELCEQSLQNSVKFRKATLIDCRKFYSSLGGSEHSQGSPVYYLTFSKYNNGASALLHKEMMQNLYNNLQDDFTVLPCSINGVIIIPYHGESLDRYRQVVDCVNRNLSKPSDFLSDSIYYYNQDGFQVVSERY